MKTIHFETVSRYARSLEPATAGLPFARGELKEKDISRGRITDGKKNFPAQFCPTAYWPDGSVKWLLVNFLADLPANQAIDYFYMANGQDGPCGGLNRQAPEIRMTEQEGRWILNNGIIRLTLGAPGESGLFHSISGLDQEYQGTEIAGPVITDEKGQEYCIRIGEQGWELIESGPVRSRIRTGGKHYNGEASWFDFEVMVTAYAGKPWIQIDYQFINREDDGQADSRKAMELSNQQAGLKYDEDYPYQYLAGIKLDLKLKSKKKAAHKQFTSSFNYQVADGGGGILENLVSADTIINTANEMFPEVLFSVYAGDWNDGERAITAGIYQAYQNFPKGIRTSPDGIRLSLLPESYENLKVPQGVARTSRIHLFLHEPDMDDRMIVDRELMLEMPPVPFIDKEDYLQSGVFSPYIPTDCHYQTERFLYRYVDARAKGLGMLHFGDGPEWEYVKQGRSLGRDIWINNEYDMPHNFMIMFARTGDRRYYDYLKAAVEHWYDVDLCHYSQQPHKEGLLYTHSVDHVTGQAVPSHQWVEGFLDYYHLTGNPKGYEAAIGIGERLLKLMELPLYHQAGLVEPREIGWAMRTFLALYRETGKERWLDACRPIVAVYLQWGREMGTFTSPYPDNYMDRVPFMIQVGIAGLYGYYQQRPEAEIKSLLIQVIDDIIRECYIPRGDFFFGKQHPAVRYVNLNGMVLETLAIGYELTGDAAYIKKGKGMFQWITAENIPPLYDFSKIKRDAFTVIYDCPWGPKRCAQSLLPLLRYYHWAMELGFLKNEEW